MTTMMTLNDVRATLIDQGYPAELVDAMLDLAGRMILEGSPASTDDVAVPRNDFSLFKWALGTVVAGAVFHTAIISLVLILLLKFS